jgi:WD40 repeat protein
MEPTWRNEFLTLLNKRNLKMKRNERIIHDYFNLLKNNPNSIKSKNIKIELENSTKDKETMVENMISLTKYLEEVEEKKMKEMEILKKIKIEKDLLLSQLESLELNRNVLTDVLLVEIRIRDDEIEEADSLKDKYLEEEELLKEKNEVLNKKLSELEDTLTVISNTLKTQQNNNITTEVPKRIRTISSSSSFHSNVINRIKFNPECTLFATCSEDGKIKLFDSATLNLHSEYSSDKGITSTSICQHQLLGTNKEGMISMWNISNHKELFRVPNGHLNEIFSCEFLGLNQFITSGNDKKIKFWNESTCIQTLHSTHSALDIALGVDANHLLSCHKDKIQMWDLRDFKLQNMIPTNKFITSIARSQDGLSILMNHQSSLEILDLRTLKIQSPYSNDEYGNSFLRNRACFSPDSNYIASGNGIISLKEKVPIMGKC